MPRRPAQPCRQPGCPNLNCQVHRPVRPVDTRPSAAARGYDQKWRRIRAAFLKKHPYCVVCGEPATEVDHIVPLAQGGTNEWRNLQAMCHSDHSQKTATFDGGFGNRRPDQKAKEKRLNGKIKTPVTIVHGPPGAGKTTYVKEHARWGDLIVDFDALYSALSGLDWYQRPAALMPFVAEARDAVINRLHRDSEVRHAWLITSEPNAAKRKALQAQLNARLVYIEANQHECLSRIAADHRRDVKGWDVIINDWFSKFTPDRGEGGSESLPVFA